MGIVMSTCKQCGNKYTGGDMGDHKGFCCAGCKHSWNLAHGTSDDEHPIDMALGLAGKAVSAAIGGARRSAEDRAAQRDAEEEQRSMREAEHHRALGERKRSEAEAELIRAQARAAESAGRHVITHEVQCLNCAEWIEAKMASDGESVVVCKHCKVKMLVNHSGAAKLLGPKDRPLSKAESLTITQDRDCPSCKSYRRYSPLKHYWLPWIATTFVLAAALYLTGKAKGWFPNNWDIVGGIGSGVVVVAGLIIGYYVFDNSSSLSEESHSCRSKKATSAAGSWDPEDINANLRCSYWTER